MGDGKEIPYIVAGCGGFAATAPKAIASAPLKVGDHTLEITPIVDFGYLTLQTDARRISIVFKTADGRSVATRDSVTVDLKSGKIVPAGQSVPAAVPGAAKTPVKRAKAKKVARKQPSKKARKQPS